jgi:hypothetical protein
VDGSASMVGGQEKHFKSLCVSSLSVTNSGTQ